MLVLHGVYENGKVEITDKNIIIQNHTPVEITVLNREKVLKRQFSFQKSRNKSHLGNSESGIPFYAVQKSEGESN